jgi:pimeloyl-ACP methyl ester carboxylesterase
MAHPTRTDTLQVPGATLYYEVSGSGPMLLLIPGGPADAGVFADLAGFLADRYTVVAYDPRGNSRSVTDGHRRTSSWTSTATTPPACWPPWAANRPTCWAAAAVRRSG